MIKRRIVHAYDEKIERFCPFLEKEDGYLHSSMSDYKFKLNGESGRE